MDCRRLAPEFVSRAKAGIQRLCFDRKNACPLAGHDDLEHKFRHCLPRGCLFSHQISCREHHRESIDEWRQSCSERVCRFPSALLRLDLYRAL